MRGSLAAACVAGMLVATLSLHVVRAEEPDAPAAIDPAAERFFEERVRPVLADQCYQCHGPDKQTSDLRLDSRSAMIDGGAEGPSLVPGDPEESLLIVAIRREGHLKMPPKEPLSEENIRDLTDWVRRGAAWPGDDGLAESASPAETHWAFQPVQPHAVPDPSGKARDPIDAFLGAKLAEAGLEPAPEADRRTLIRRLSFDLIGLPPTPEEVETFQADDRPDAYERLVDRLLASPQHGERWGRHWLDVARYSDTKGYVFTEERRYPFSYTYRDYVVNAHNSDKPYDRFLIEQIAADALPDAQPADLAAMGFLTVGRRFLNNNEDIIDDRIDVVTRGVMGLTVTCARCHDHKYDPIPTADYYSLYGVFASSVEPPDLPIIGESVGPESAAYVQAVAEKQKVIDDHVAERLAAYRADLREKSATYLLAAFDMEFNPRHAQYEERVRSDDLRPTLLRRFMGKFPARLESNDPFLAPWKAFASLSPEAFAAEAPAVAARLLAERREGAEELVGPPAPDLPWVIAAEPPGSLRDVVARYGELLARAANSETPATAAVEAARAFLDAADGPFAIAEDEARRLFDRADRDRFRELERQRDAVDVDHPGAPPRAMVMNDRPEPIRPRIFIRGNIGRQGDEVPRQFLQILAGEERSPFPRGSGRLDLAEAIASPDNPLTARVLVNRVWMLHFGEGLVGTPGDFGLRGDPPTHPELLDHLAARFVADGWSLKRLHRAIVGSHAYRQSSAPRPETLAADPQNHLLARQSPRRLDFEALRDALLAVSGRLDPRTGGRSVPLASDPNIGRRTLYAFIDRQNLDGLFRTFDLPSPDASAPKRPQTTVPQQALFLLNSPFSALQARHLAGRLGSLPAEDVDARITLLYRLALARAPEPDEVEAGRAFLEILASPEAASDASPEHLDPWAAYAQVLLESNEFAFVD